MLSLSIKTSPALTAVPSVAVVLSATRTVGVVSLVSASAATVGAPGAVLSSAWLWALEIAVRLVDVPMAVEASAMALCSDALTVTPANMSVTVVESARFTTAPLADVESTLAKLEMTVAPAPADPLSAKATMVATWAAAFCASTLLLAIGS